MNNIKQFIGELESLLDCERSRNQLLMPKAIDLFHRINEDLMTNLEIVLASIRFLSLPDPSKRIVYNFHKITFDTFATQLKIKHADVIGMLNLTSGGMRCCNTSFSSVFIELDRQLQLNNITDDNRRSDLTDVLITIIKLAFNNAIPKLLLPNLNIWVEVDYPAMDYAFAHSLVGYNNIFRLSDGEVGKFVNSNNGRYFDLKVEEFNMGYLIALLAPRTSYSTDELLVDIMHFGIDISIADKIIEDWK